MTANLLDWYALTREAVPGVLLGVEPTSGPIQIAAQAPSKQSADLMVGIASGSLSSSLVTPYIALVSESNVGDLFAWLHTFSNESFPISQFCRIESTGNWNALLNLKDLNLPFRGSVWASIIAGEMLANAEQSIEPKAMPLSWASSCFTLTIAKTYRVVGHQVAVAIDSVKRLRTIESDPRFFRRKVSVDMLSVIWEISANSDYQELGTVRDIVESTISAVDRNAGALIRENKKLMSNSAEQRIHGYDEFVDALLSRQHRGQTPVSIGVGALLAGAALVAGGSTSHIDLLKPYADEFPDCLPWFGLLAGLAGPRAWDSDWLRLVKGVERQIRGSNQFTDPLQGDLCWIEFDWLRQLSKSSSIFNDLPKNHNRLLSIEVFPGATYQARLITSPPETRAPARLEPQPESLRSNQSSTNTKQSSQSDDLLTQLATVSSELQRLVTLYTERSLSAPDAEQGELFDGKPAKTVKAAKQPSSRARKGTAKS